MTSLLLVLHLVVAAPPSEADRLFSEARALMKTRPAEACPLFEKSLELDPALGTLLNLALCLEETGRTASAWLRFNQARDWASRTHEADREKLARQHADGLAPKLAWLAFSCARPAPGLEVDVAQQTVSLSAPVSVPVDPGTHTVRAKAPGFVGWTTKVAAPAPGATLRVEVPELEPLSKPTAAAPLVPAATPAEKTPPTAVVVAPTPAPPSRVPGIATLVGGGVLVVAGTVGLVYSLDVYTRAQSQRVDAPTSQPPTVTESQFNTARTLYPVSLAALGVGVAASGLGIWLLVREPAGAVSVSAAPIPGGAAVFASGEF